MEEIWKDVVGYEGLYQVSNFGRIKHLEHYKRRATRYGKEFFVYKKEFMLNCFDNHQGYMVVSLYKNKKFKQARVHRVVAEAFIENKYNLEFINHKDENKSNNHINNLEWCTAKYNNNYGTRMKKIADSLTNGKRSKPVVQMLNGIDIMTFPSTREVERIFGYKHYHISACCNGKEKTSYGYTWRYVEGFEDRCRTIK